MTFRQWRKRHFPKKDNWTLPRVVAWFYAEHDTVVTLSSMKRWHNDTRNPKPHIRAIMDAKDAEDGKA